MGWGRLVYPAVVLSAVALAPNGCRSQIDDAPQTCTPGEVRSCICGNRPGGSATCREDGMGFSPCSCAAGSGGAGASGGGGAGGSGLTSSTGGGGSGTTSNTASSSGAGGTAPFTPAAISGLSFWLDASDAPTVTLNGSTVLSIVDKSTHGLVFNATAGPAYALAQQNGLNTIELNPTGNAQLLQASTPSVTLRTIVFAARFDSAMQLCTGGYFYDLRPNDNGAQPWLYGYDCDNGFVALSEARANNVISPSYASYEDSLWQVSLFEINGPVTSDMVTLFGRFSFAEGAKVSFGEVAGYDRVLVEGEKTQLYDYLATKWQ